MTQLYIQNVFFNQIIPKLLATLNDLDKQKSLHNILNQKNPKYKQLIEASIIPSHEIIVKNSLSLSMLIDDEDISDVTSKLSALTSLAKPKIIIESKEVIYSEIIEALSYAQHIRNLIENYSWRNSAFDGSAHTNSALKKLVKQQMRYLKDRLNHHYFALQNKDEIETTKFMIKVLKASLDKESSYLIESMNFARITIGLDISIVDVTKNELAGLSQVLDFFNGFKTRGSELVRSVMIFWNYTFKAFKGTSAEKAELIDSLVRFFFNNEINKANEAQANALSFNETHVQRSFEIKTIYHDVPIYVFERSGKSFLEKFIEGGVIELFGEEEYTDVSQFGQLRALAKVKKDYKLTKEETHIFAYLFKEIVPSIIDS